jgi:hypothetical protein
MEGTAAVLAEAIDRIGAGIVAVGARLIQGNSLLSKVLQCYRLSFWLLHE